MDAPVQEEHALVEGSQFCLTRWWTRRRPAHFLVLLPRSLLALGGAEVSVLHRASRFCRGGLADVALASRFLQHVI